MSVNHIELDLLQFFEGPTEGWGIFEDRMGKLRREFSIEMLGRMEGDRLNLDETIAYDDGSRIERQWALMRHGDGTIVGTAPDIVGEARGREKGREFAMRYTMTFPMNGRTIDFTLKDRYLLRQPGILINRASLHKFGIRIGEIYGTFRRVEAAAESLSHVGMLEAAE